MLLLTVNVLGLLLFIFWAAGAMRRRSRAEVRSGVAEG